jgi:phospholipid/cholesterol/gamma-HCH transport system substrate-binding protein
METKANTALIGAFTLIVLALGFVFIYWLARGSENTSNTRLKVVFEDPVTGLSVGSQVVFNGIKIGEVKALDLDPNNPKIVVAGLAVQPLKSIKTDTQVTLGFQGLTGVGYVEMAGGSPDRPPIWTAMPDPTIKAARSSMQDLLAGARGIMSRADATLKTIENLVAENRANVAQSIKDVQRFTGALAQNSDKVAGMVDNIATAANGVADATKRLQGIVERSQALVEAVDPQQVRTVVADVATTTHNLAGQSARFAGIVDRADKIAANAEAFSNALPELGAKAGALASAIDAKKLGATLDRVNAIAAAVDPAKVRTTVEGAASLAQTIQNNRDNLQTIVTKMASLSSDLAAFSGHLPKLGDRADSLMAAIDPAKLGHTVDNLDKVTGTLADNRANIDEIIANTKNLSARFDKLGSRAEALMTKLDSMAGSGTGGLVEDARTTLAAVRQAAETISKQVTTVGNGVNNFNNRGLREVQNLVSQGQRTLSRLDSAISNVEQNPSGLVFGGPGVPEYNGHRR